MSTTLSNIGPFCGSFAANQHPAAHLRAALRRFERRFGVEAEVVMCCPSEVPALRDAFPDLTYQSRFFIGAGLLYLARNGEAS